MTIFRSSLLILWYVVLVLPQGPPGPPGFNQKGADALNNLPNIPGVNIPPIGPSIDQSQGPEEQPMPPTQENQDYDYPDQGPTGEDQKVDLAPVNPAPKAGSNTPANANIIVQSFIEGDKNTNIKVSNTSTNTVTNTNVQTTSIQQQVAPKAPKQVAKQPPKQQPKKKVKKAKKKTKKQVKCIPCNNHARCKRQSKQLTVCYPVKCQGAADAWKGTCGAPWKPAKKAPKAKQVPVCPKTIVSNGQRICRVNKKA